MKRIPAGGHSKAPRRTLNLIIKIFMEDIVNNFNKYEPWKDVTSYEWTDWKWQYSHCIESVEDLQKILTLTETEINGITKATSLYKMKVSPHICLMIAENANSAVATSLKRQFLPSIHEIVKDNRLFDDVNSDEEYMPVNGLVHRYPTKVLVFPSNNCGSFCRYCFRKKFVGNKEKQLSCSELGPIFTYLKNNPNINEVIFSGGDPLTVSNNMISYMLGEISQISSVKTIRFHTRMPITIPYRLDTELVQMLVRYRDRFAIYFVIHIDSLNELSAESLSGISRLTNNGIMCLASCPLLKGINDSEEILGKLWRTLVENRVKPYYLFHTDPVQGIQHFVVPLSQGMSIMQNLYDRISGLAIPLYCFNVPGGGGHILISPPTVKKLAPNRYLIKNFEGKYFEYTEPIDGG